MSLSLTVKDLLDAGVHFGHQTKRWNPRSKPFVFDHRQGITIVDLAKTHEQLAKAHAFLEETVANGGDVLFVGTKRQAQEIVREAATSVGMPYAVNRWLGGTLTNFETVKKSLAKFKKYQQMDTSGELAKLHSKEESAIRREMVRMTKNFAGIAEITKLPTAMFIVDVNHENIAAAEAKRCGVKSVGLVDTNSDPGTVDFPVPGNDDAVKSIRCIVDAVVAAIQSGLAPRDTRRNARGQSDIQATNPAVAAAAGIAPEGEVDLSKVQTEVLADGAPATPGAPAPKAPAPRRKIAAPK